jgi:hypothetical protein
VGTAAAASAEECARPWVARGSTESSVEGGIVIARQLGVYQNAVGYRLRRLASLASTTRATVNPASPRPTSSAVEGSGIGSSALTT